jgi:hypothetical protein
MKIETTEDRRAFALAGAAVITLQGKTSRYTYRIKANKKAGARATHYVSVLRGPNNESEDEYKFIGGITSEGFYLSDKSALNIDSPCVRAFGWWWAHIDSQEVEVYHAGKCGRCGRLLTTPESIKTGLGPVCAGLA